jgi:hypothetical protein
MHVLRRVLSPQKSGAAAQTIFNFVEQFVAAVEPQNGFHDLTTDFVNIVHSVTRLFRARPLQW